MSAGSELASARAGTADVGEIIRRVVAEEAASDSVRIGWGRVRAVSSMTPKVPQVSDLEAPGVGREPRRWGEALLEALDSFRLERFDRSETALVARPCASRRVCADQ